MIGITAQIKTKIEFHMNEQEDKYNLYFNSPVAQSTPFSYYILKLDNNARLENIDEEVSSLSR